MTKTSFSAPDSFVASAPYMTLWTMLTPRLSMVTNNNNAILFTLEKN